MVDARDPSRGVLVDLDIAARIRDGDRRLNPSLPHAGTLGYRAIDLLERDTHHPDAAFYRHDLESFFYVLVYITILYRNGERLPISNSLQSWWEPRLKGNMIMKGGFLVRPVRGGTDPHPLLSQWVNPLRVLFDKAYDRERDHFVDMRDAQAPDWTDEQKESFDDTITFDKFMELLV